MTRSATTCRSRRKAAFPMRQWPLGERDRKSLRESHSVWMCGHIPHSRWRCQRSLRGHPLPVRFPAASAASIWRHQSRLASARSSHPTRTARAHSRPGSCSATPATPEGSPQRLVTSACPLAARHVTETRPRAQPLPIIEREPLPGVSRPRSPARAAPHPRNACESVRSAASVSLRPPERNRRHEQAAQDAPPCGGRKRRRQSISPCRPIRMKSVHVHTSLYS